MQGDEWVSAFSYDKDKEKNILDRLKRQQPANACNKRFSSLLRRMRRLGRWGQRIYCVVEGGWRSDNGKLFIRGAARTGRVQTARAPCLIDGAGTQGPFGPRGHFGPPHRIACTPLIIDNHLGVGHTVYIISVYFCILLDLFSDPGMVYVAARTWCDEVQIIFKS